MADSMVWAARNEARVACQAEGAPARQGAGDGGWHLLQRCGKSFLSCVTVQYASGEGACARAR